MYGAKLAFDNVRHALLEREGNRAHPRGHQDPGTFPCHGDGVKEFNPLGNNAVTRCKAILICLKCFVFAWFPSTQLLALSLTTCAQESPSTEWSLGPQTIVSAVMESPNSLGISSESSGAIESFFLHGALCILHFVHMAQFNLLGKCVRQ